MKASYGTLNSKESKGNDKQTSRCNGHSSKSTERCKVCPTGVGRLAVVADDDRDGFILAITTLFGGSHGWRFDLLSAFPQAPELQSWSRIQSSGL